MNPVPGHPAYRIRQKGMPVPVTPVNRQSNTSGLHLPFQGRDQRPILRVDRADSAEMMVVFRDLQHAFLGDATTLEHALEKGDDIGGSLRPSKRNQE